MTLNTECPLCRDRQHQHVETTYVYGGSTSQKYIHCNNCDLYYLFPKPSEDELSLFYKHEFESFMHNRSGADSNWEDAIKHSDISMRDAKRRMLFIRDSLRQSENILEIGASSGFMIKQIQKSYKNKNIYAVEPSDYFFNFMKQQNINAYQSLDSIPEKIKFDLIMHFFVVAHVYDFSLFLKQQYDKLKKGGKIIFETPSATDPLLKMYDIPAFHKFYWQVAHLVSFTPKSMAYLLNQMNFKYKLIPHQRYDLSNHMVWMQTGKPGGRNKYSNIFSKKLEKEYKKSLEESWQCDTLVVEIIK